MTRDAYIPQLDALRFLAFLMVFAVHALPANASSFPIGGNYIALAIGAGRFGVDVFFTLSGFLITRLLLAEKMASGDIDLRRFAIRRIRRIWPLYFAVLILCAPLISPAQFLAFATFSGNFYLPLVAVPAFAVAPMWSLCLEQQFYIVWPWLVRNTRHIATMAGIGLVAPLAIRCGMEIAGVAGEAAWSLPFTRTDSLAVGVILAIRPVRIGLWALPLIVAGFLTSEWLLRGACWPLAYTVAAGSSGLALCAALSLPNVRVAEELGKRSYGMYLFHAGIITATHGILPGWQVLALGSTIVLAALSHRFLERPIASMPARAMSHQGQRGRQAMG